MSELTHKQKVFCESFLITGNAREAARQAGYKCPVASAADKAYGKNANDYIEHFLNDINGATRPDSRENALLSLGVKFKRYAVAMKASVAIQQPSAIMRSMAFIPPQYFAGLVPSVKAYNEMLQHSGTAISKEIGGFDAYTGRSAAQWIMSGITPSIGDVADKVTGTLPQFMDAATWSVMWQAVKREVAQKQGFKKNSPELLEAAGKRFDDVMAYSQVYDSILTRGDFMRGKTARLKLLTAFKAEATTTYNMWLWAVSHLGDKTAKGSGKYTETVNLDGDTVRTEVGRGGFGMLLRVATSTIAAGVFNSLLKSLVSAAMDDDDKQSYWDRYIEALAGNLLGDKWSTISSLYEDDVSLPDSPGVIPYSTGDLDVIGNIPFVNDILSILQGYSDTNSDTTVYTALVKAISNLSRDTLTEEQKIKGLVVALGDALGLPATAVAKQWVPIFEDIYSGITGNQAESSGDVWYEIREGLSIDQTKYLYQYFDNAVTTGNYSKLDKQFNIMVERSDSSDPKKSIGNKIVDITKQYYYSGDISESAAKKMLLRYAYDKEDDADKKIATWEFWRDYGDHDKDDESKTSMAMKYKEFCKSAGVSKKVFLEAWKYCKNLESDKDADGESISGSVKLKTLNYIDNLKLSDKQRTAMYKAFGYDEEDMADREVSQDFWSDYAGTYTAEDVAKTYMVDAYNEHCKALKVDKVIFYDCWKYKQNTKADKDKDGKSISGSAQKKVWAYIDSKNLTANQKDALHLAFGYSENTLSKTPWRSKKK